MKRVSGRQLRMQALRLLLLTGLMLAGLTTSHAMVANAATGACTAPSTDYGTVTSTVTIPAGTATASYRVWSRIAATDATNDHFLLEVDGPTTNCFQVGGSAGKVVPVYSATDDANGTRFVNDKTNWFNTDTSGAGISVNLPAGTTTFKMIGDAPGLVIDRVIFTQDTSCTPIGPGDNCIPTLPADAPPVGSITSPATGSSVTNPDILVSATDDVAVTGVDIYDGSTKLGSATLLSGSSANGVWKYTWNTAAIAAGSSHTLTAAITDGVNSVVNTGSMTVTIADTTKPSTPVITVPANNSTQTGDFTATATATDNVAVTKMKFFVDGTLNATAITAPFSKLISTTGLTPGSTHTLTATAWDAANNISALSAPITFTYSPQVSSSPPTVDITNVDSSTIVSSDLTIANGQNNDELNSQTYTVSTLPVDNSGTGIKQVELFLDNVSVGIHTTDFDFAVDMRFLSDSKRGCGTHTLKAVVTDKEATPKTGTATTTFKVAKAADIDANCVANDLGDFSAIYRQGLKPASQLTNPRVDVDRNGTVENPDISRVIGAIKQTNGTY